MEELMDYRAMMEDCTNYIKKHPDENLTPELFGKMYSCRPGYVSFLFGCYCEDPLDIYIKKVKIISGVSKEHRKYPSPRWVGEEKIQTKYEQRKELYVEAYPVIKDEKSLYRPIDASVTIFNEQCEESQVAFWYRDKNYDMSYLQGNLIKECKNGNQKNDLIIPGGMYAVFSYRTGSITQMGENIKKLIHYAHTDGFPFYQEQYDSSRFPYILFQKKEVFYCVPIFEQRKEKTEEKDYGVELWTRYIEDHLMSEMTTLEIANQLGYSGTQFKRKFKERYRMSVADYVRKQKMMRIAEMIREGMDYVEVYSLYGFRTYVGFSRAFRKEFLVTPAVYTKGSFATIDASRYCAAWSGKIHVAILEIEKILTEVKPIIMPGKNEPDIPAQINYWKKNGFPALPRTRYSCNVECREDKIALWHHELYDLEHKYLIGPVVHAFEENVTADTKQLVLQQGKYAIFSTERVSDEDYLPETLEMFARCIFFGWCKEWEEVIDYTRFSFERYVNNKLYFYVPVK